MPKLGLFLGDLTGQRADRVSKSPKRCGEGRRDCAALAEARAALGFVRCFADWNFAEGLSELKRAKELSPANPTANDLLARIIVYLGQFDEAERQARQAVELDPLIYCNARQSGVAFFSMPENSMRQTRLHARPRSCNRPVLAIIDGRCSSLPNAVTARQPCAKRNWSPIPAFAGSSWRWHIMSAEIGQAADAALADLIANAREGFAYQIAEVYALRGEKDKAFEWLQTAFDDRDAGMLGLLVDPLLRGLRDDARYKNLLAKVGLPTTS